jgi:hypothetical protein
MQTREDLTLEEIKKLEDRAKEWRGKSLLLYTKDELLEIADRNHIWLNGFQCINPSDEFLKDIGRMILHKLDRSEMRDSTGISREIILTINKS